MPRHTKHAAPTAAVAVGYVRVSTEEQAREGVSLDAQTEKLRAYCTLHGLTLATIYRDEGVSAGKPLTERPEGAKLLAAIGSGEATHVVALKLDRLFRDAVDCLQTARQWDANGIAMHLIDLGGQTVNTASAMGRFFLTVMAGAAEMERNLIRERTRTALAHKRSRGDRLGTTPLGFHTPAPGQSMERNDVELETVRLILTARRRRKPVPFRQIAAQLAAGGHQTKRGGVWAPATVKRIWDARARYSMHLDG
jgi:site-specific DNA recombinase